MNPIKRGSAGPHAGPVGVPEDPAVQARDLPPQQALGNALDLRQGAGGQGMSASNAHHIYSCVQHSLQACAGHPA